MRTLLKAGVVAVLTLPSGTGFAVAEDATVTYSGINNTECFVNPDFQTVNINMTTTLGGTIVDIVNNAVNINIFCNDDFTLSVLNSAVLSLVQSGLPTTPPPGFENEVNLLVTTTGATPGLNPPTLGTFSVDVGDTTTSLPLVAGDYSGSVTVVVATF